MTTLLFSGIMSRHKNRMTTYYITPGVRLQGDWGEIVALECSKSPWEALRATKTSPSIFATFEKANTCEKRTFLLGEIQLKLNKHAKVKFF